MNGEPKMARDFDPDADVPNAVSGLREAIERLGHQVMRAEKTFSMVLRPADPSGGSELKAALSSSPSPLGHDLSQMRDEISNLADVLANVCNRSAL